MGCGRLWIHKLDPQLVGCGRTLKGSTTTTHNPPAPVCPADSTEKDPWPERLADVCPACGLRTLDASGRCRCGASKVRHARCASRPLTAVASKRAFRSLFAASSEGVHPSTASNSPKTSPRRKHRGSPPVHAARAFVRPAPAGSACRLLPSLAHAAPFPPSFSFGGRAGRLGTAAARPRAGVSRHASALGGAAAPIRHATSLSGARSMNDPSSILPRGWRLSVTFAPAPASTSSDGDVPWLLVRSHGRTFAAPARWDDYRGALLGVAARAWGVR